MLRALAPLLALLGGSALACGGAAPLSSTLPTPPAHPPPAPSPVAIASPAPPSPCAPAVARRVTPASRTGSSIALVDDGARRLVYVADEEGRALHTVDADALAEIAVTELPGSPAQVLPLADGRVLVTLRDTNRLLALEPGARPEEPLRTRCARATYTEPFGIAVSPDGARVAVTAGMDHRLMILDAPALGVERSVDLPAEPRGVLVSADGAAAYVAHLTGGVVSVVPLAHPDEPAIYVRPGLRPRRASPARPRSSPRGRGSRSRSSRWAKRAAAPGLRGSSSPWPARTRSGSAATAASPASTGEGEGRR